MSYETTNVDGEEKVVREDVAKKHRGVTWALLSIGGFILIAGALLFSGLLSIAADPDPEPSPAISNQAAQ